MPGKTPTLSLETGMLSYARSMQITEGLFYATRSDDSDIRTPIEVREKGVRGQSSEDNAKNPGKSNPQSVEFAVIPQDHDGVELAFSVRVMPLSMQPHACGNTEVGDAYRRLAEGYREAGGYRVLAELFAWNIANARFAWRNRFQSDSMTVTVSFDDVSLTFDPFHFDLATPVDAAGMAAALVEGDPEDVSELIDEIAEGLSNKRRAAFTMKVTWNARMEAGQEIFPSQEYIREEKADKTLSRVFAKLPVERGGRTVMQASMHSQKIGAALRHIDMWHGSEAHDQPIAVNPYGGVQETSAVLRDKGTKRSFYDLRKKAGPLLDEVEGADTAEDLSGDTHFLMANLVRGGVFGASNKAAEKNE